jgi:hypothetical protein
VRWCQTIRSHVFSTGKTVILNTLADAQTRLGLKTSLYTINPKAMNIMALYGTLDPLTRTSCIYIYLYDEISSFIVQSSENLIVNDH